MRVMGNWGTRDPELVRSTLSSLKYHEPVMSWAGTDSLPAGSQMSNIKVSAG